MPPNALIIELVVSDGSGREVTLTWPNQGTTALLALSSNSVGMYSTRNVIKDLSGVTLLVTPIVRLGDVSISGAEST